MTLSKILENNRIIITLILYYNKKIVYDAFKNIGK